MAGPTYGVLWIDNYALKHAATERDELDYAASAGIEGRYQDIETMFSFAAARLKCERSRRYVRCTTSRSRSL
jgi:hypothetical protein